MPFAQVGGTRLFYGDTGSGRQVVMVPGIAADHRHWNKAIPFFGDGFRIITVDNRGSGVTEYEGGFSMDDLADDIIGLLDYLGIDRADLLGWSMGSHICLDAAARHPERVRSLCLVQSYGYRPARPAYILRQKAEAYSEGAIDGDTFGAVLNSFMYSEERFRAMEAQGTQAGKAEMPEPGKIMDQLAAADGYDPSVHARMVRCPVMSVHGLADIMTEPREGDALADMVGCSRRVRIPGEGHMVSKKAYMEEYIDFLRSLRDVPPPLWRLSYV